MSDSLSSNARTVFVTGADRGLGLSLCEVFLQRGWRVFGGQFMPEWPDLNELAERYQGRLHVLSLDVSDMASVQNAAAIVSGITGQVDMLINNAGVTGRGMEQVEGLVFNVNSLGPLRMVETFLPLMQGGMKRLCFVSSEAGSVAVCTRTGMYGYTMSKTALNMGIRHLHNHLYTDGFTFRVYHPGWLRSYMSGQKNEEATVEPIDSALFAVDFFINGTKYENALQMVDERGAVWPF